VLAAEASAKAAAELVTSSSFKAAAVASGSVDDEQNHVPSSQQTIK
jgi:hypothetical protein